MGLFLYLIVPGAKGLLDPRKKRACNKNHACEF
jgi:hypothetical protein